MVTKEAATFRWHPKDITLFKTNFILSHLSQTMFQYLNYLLNSPETVQSRSVRWSVISELGNTRLQVEEVLGFEIKSNFERKKNCDIFYAKFLNLKFIPRVSPNSLRSQSLEILTL